MIDNVGRERNMRCREARKRFAALLEDSTGNEREATERHVQSCSRCAGEYRLFALHRATLDAAAAPELVTPDDDFFRGLRARIARGPELSRPFRGADESWTAALLLTARQLLPAMAVLLLLMLGATFLWKQPLRETREAALRPRERVMFSDVYDYPEPTRDDVLETLVAVEEKENGK